MEVSMIVEKLKLGNRNSGFSKKTSTRPCVLPSSVMPGRPIDSMQRCSDGLKKKNLDYCLLARLPEMVGGPLTYSPQMTRGENRAHARARERRKKSQPSAAVRKSISGW